MPPQSYQNTNACLVSSEGPVRGLHLDSACAAAVSWTGENRGRSTIGSIRERPRFQRIPASPDLLLEEEGTMVATLRRLPAVAGLAVLAAICAEVAGHRAFTRLVRRDVQALLARASPGRAGVVTEEMLTDLPEPDDLVPLRLPGREHLLPGGR